MLDISNIQTLINETPILSKLLYVLAVILGAIIAKFILIKLTIQMIRRSIRLQKFSSKKSMEQREETLTSVFNAALQALIVLVSISLILTGIGVNIMPLLAGAGVLGVALGFGAQSMVKDFLAGIFIIAENQYRVGDVLQVNQDVAGVVEHVSLRMTTIRSLDGKVHYIPNGNITIATNMTMEYSNVVVDIGVSYNDDIDKVERVINQVGKDIFKDEKWRDVALEAPYMLRINEFGESAVIVRVVCKTAPIRQWEVKGEILRRVKAAFDKEGITIPLPQRVVHKVNN